MARRVPNEPQLRSMNDLLSRYKERLQPPQKTVETAVIEVIYDVLAIELQSTHVTYTPNNKQVFLRVSGVVKTEVLLQKEAILTHLRGRLGVHNSPQDIT